MLGLKKTYARDGYIRDNVKYTRNNVRYIRHNIIKYRRVKC